MFKINHIQTQFSSLATGKSVLFCLLAPFYFLITSCSNDHCNESMFAPMVVSFHSEIDTSQLVAPLFMAVEGIGSDNYMNASGVNSIQLPLKKFDNTCRFLFATATQESPVDTLVFIRTVNSSDCPCTHTSEETVNEYRLHNDIVYLCQESGSMLILYQQTPAIAFTKEKKPDTLFTFRPTQDILNVAYTNTLEFISAECGGLATFHLDNLRFERNNIGEISVVNPSVTSTYNEKHVRIYLENY